MADVVGELSAEKHSHLRWTWKVPGFLDLRKKYLRCPKFRFADASWRVAMYQNFYSSKTYIFIDLERGSSVPEHGVSFTLGLMTSRGGEEILLDCFQDINDYIEVVSLKRSVLGERRDLWVPDGNLTLYLDMRLTASDSLDVRRTESAGTPSAAPALYHEEELRKRLQSLEKLQSDYEELLKSVDDLSVDNVFGLYAAAEKNDLQTLKSECLEFMRRSLTVDCFCDVMMLSLRYKAEELTDLAIDFFKENIAQIIVTVKWQVFLKENITTANKIFIKALVPAGDKP